MRQRQLTISDGVKRVLSELSRFGVLEGDSIISTNLQVRLDGLPRSGQSAPADPGVAVYWTRPSEKGTKVMAIDIYDRVADNLGAIAATLEAMRQIERHGGAVVLERAFTGFDALPAPGQETARTWRAVMEFGPDEAVTLDAAKRRYRELSSSRHPDRGGTHEEMSALNSAWQQAQAALGPQSDQGTTIFHA